MAKEISQELQDALKCVCDHFDKEDRQVRDRQIRIWKKLKYYWSGFQRIYWSETAHDYRIVDNFSTLGAQGSQDAAAYDKEFNVFRAYLDSIIAALSVTVPPIVCIPDDAENDDDLATARNGNKIATLLFRHNNSTLLWLHALFIYCTEGLLCAYNYSKEDEKYGTYKDKKYEDAEETVDSYICPLCQMNMGDPNISDMARNEYDPDNPDETLLLDEGNLCSNCMQNVDPKLVQTQIKVSRLVDEVDKPKASQCIEVYGGLFVKTPIYAKCQKDMPYLELAFETHYTNVWEWFPNLRGITFGLGRDSWDRWGRQSTQYGNTEATETPTVKYFWLRPSAFWACGDVDLAEKLRKEFPDGAKVCWVNERFAEACNEDLDDHWTCSHNPLSDYMHYDPIGLFLVSVQEITNDLNALVLQTIEHGIPQTFADPNVLDFNEYSQNEVAPGMIYQAKPASGKSLSDAFYEVKTAQLSGEVLPYSEKVQAMGQLVSGALPSLFGGPQPNSSKTAAQYSMSRASALQRLQNPWKMLTIWWKDIFSKVIPAYIKTVVEDEHFTVRKGDNSFDTVYIRRAQLNGKIGSVELEANEQLPLAWSQQKDVIMQLFQGNNPEVMSILGTPENLNLIKRVFGLEEFDIPGERDREKQYAEIRLLTESAPTVQPTPPSEMEPMGGEVQRSSVEVEPLADNHPIHIEICKTWLVGEAGRLAKIENPDGYKNVLLHMKEHMDIARAFAMQNAAMQQQSQPQKPEKQKPIAAQVKKNAGSATVQ